MSENNKYYAAPVIVEDPSAEAIDFYFLYVKGKTTLTADLDSEGTVISVDDATGAVVGEAVQLTGAGFTSQFLISAIDGKNITLSNNSDFSYFAGSTCRFGAWNLALDGSSSSIMAELIPCENAEWEIENITINGVTETKPDDGKFIGITALTSPVLFRKRNHLFKNIAIVTNNAGFKEQGFVVTYSDRARAGEYGVFAKKDFKNFNGIVEYLSGGQGDVLQFLINSDLTGLTQFAVTGHGHKKGIT